MMGCEMASMFMRYAVLRQYGTGEWTVEIHPRTTWRFLRRWNWLAIVGDGHAYRFKAYAPSESEATERAFAKAVRAAKRRKIRPALEPERHMSFSSPPRCAVGFTTSGIRFWSQPR